LTALHTSHQRKG